TGTRAEWQENARKAEALGYDVLLMGDHMGNAGSPLPSLLSAADATTTLRICPHVLAVDFRNPAILAKEAATIDVLTDGRFGLGVADQVDLVRQAAGERFLDLEFATFSIRPVVTDAVDLSDVMEAFAAEYNTPLEVAATIPATLAGSVDALVERLQQHREEL